MKKLSLSLLAFMMAAVACVGFASCGDDDDDEGSFNLTYEEAMAALQGTWDVTVTEKDDEDTETWKEVWTISDKYYIVKENGSRIPFTVKDGKMVLHADSSFPDEYTITKLTANSFHFYDTGGKDGEQWREDYYGTKRK